ncbi:hypothetical protein K435DRAFT_868607 [Dendrothele bispora CBS 962.96]|uniref:Uncharacterized protein n=1 Tax=Dendrothele bispora (strain CBS 962.96) TaxID=1314807 RepID=A0A4S8LBB3_DENBC|nr:hypothetical protein K435DRAFT_868607 [Dendrothele bispora CBS 962.96]
MSNAVASPNNGQQEAQDTTNRAGLLRGEDSNVDFHVKALEIWMKDENLDISHYVTYDRGTGGDGSKSSGEKPK